MTNATKLTIFRFQWIKLPILRLSADLEAWRIYIEFAHNDVRWFWREYILLTGGGGGGGGGGGKQARTPT